MRIVKVMGVCIALLGALLVLASPGGDPRILISGNNVSAELVALRIATGLVDQLPSGISRYLDVASLEKIIEGGSDGAMKKPDQPAAWAEYRRMQLSSDTNGTVKPNGLMEAHTARRALVANSFAESQGILAGAAGISSGQWTWIGPGNQGGRIRSILVHPTVAGTLWVGSVGGGIWKSTNSGASWTPVQDFMANLAVTSLAMDSSSATTMYAATGEGFYNIDAIRGAGIFKSTDGGATWAQLSSTNPATTSSDFYYVNRISAHPSVSGTILAATQGGIYRSTNSGTSWSKVFSSAYPVTDVKYMPTNGNYALMGNGYYGGYIYYSSNGGQTWSASNLSVSGRTEIAWGTGGIAYAVGDVNGGTLYKTTNYGVSWSLVATPGHLSGQGWYANAIWVNPSNNSEIIIGGLDLWRSTNGGVNFSKVSSWTYGGQYGPTAHADHHVIASMPTYNGSSVATIYFGNDGGMYRTDSVSTLSTSGTSWINLNNGLGVTQFYGGAGHSGTNGRIVGGAQDNGDLYYTGSGTNWSMFSGGDGGKSAIDPNDGNYIYGEYVNLRIHRSTNGGATSSDIISGLYDANSSSNSLFIAPFAIDRWNPNNMWAGGTSLWYTTSLKSTATWSSAYYVGQKISQVALGSSTNVWFGTVAGGVYNNTNALSSPGSFSAKSGLPTGRAVLSIFVDRSNTNIVYVGFAGYNTGNIWKSTNGGSTWTNIHGALPASPVYAIQTNPTNPNYLYVGTEVGLITSEDGGTTWSATNDGPANVSVQDLFWLDNTTIVAVTHGRGMFKATVNLNSTFDISYTKAGSGSGTVNFSPAGTVSSCSSTCTNTYNSGTSVTLSASAPTGSVFAGWAGACSGTSTCTVTMSAAKSVTATFNTAPTYAITLTKAGTGSGTVNFSPTGTTSSCSATCTNTYTSGTVVTLSASASAGSLFAGWAGACSGTSTCTVTMSAAKSVTATFNTAPTYAITLTKAGTGSGTVNFSPAGTKSSCSATCTNSYTSGTVVTLSASASVGSAFAGWAGACSGTSTCTVTMSAAKSVTATFNTAPTYAITLTKAGTGSGTVNFSPSGTMSSCSVTCTNTYTSGTVVTLSASASAGSVFAGWGGVCSGTSTCTVTMSAAKSVTATFNTAPTYAITLTKAGTGSGTVNFSPAGTTSSCSATCTNTYTSGTVVTLSASASAGSVFAGWGGVCSGTSTCTVTMSAAKSVTATFNTAPTCSGLGCAVDDTFTWSTYYSSASPFYSQSSYYSGYSGSSAARSGLTSNSGYTCMYTALTAPGTLSVLWTPSSENGYDYVTLYINDVFKKGYSGNGIGSGTWFQDTYSVTGSGSFYVDLCYEKDYSTAAYLDAGFVDAVSYTSSASTLTRDSEPSPIKISLLNSQKIFRPSASSNSAGKFTVRDVAVDPYFAIAPRKRSGIMPSPILKNGPILIPTPRAN